MLHILATALLAGFLGVNYTTRAEGQSTDASSFPRIGVLADSQITTTNVPFSEESGMRTKAADLVVPVAIRPPAVEALASQALEYFLNQLTNVDLILFLGDGANSGCSDELNALFDVLRRRQGRKDVPIFMVIGNHDYLGSGNTTHTSRRRSLCGTNATPVAKYEVLTNIAAFNRATADLFPEVITNYCDNLDKLDPKLAGQPSAHTKGCFLATRFLFQKNPTSAPVEFVLADSSDYKDIGLLPKLNLILLRHELFGSRGSISFKGEESQNHFFKQFTNESMWRVVASHYPTWEFRPKWGGWISLLGLNWVGKPSELILGTNRTLWISGHTHKTTGKQPLSYQLNDKKYSCAGINVCSTIDVPMGATCVFRESNSFSFSNISAPVNAELQRRIATCINIATNCRPILGLTNGEVIFGLTKAYQVPAWKAEQTWAAQANVLQLVSSFKGDTEAATILVRMGADHEAENEQRTRGKAKSDKKTKIEQLTSGKAKSDK